MSEDCNKQYSCVIKKGNNVIVEENVPCDRQDSYCGYNNGEKQCLCNAGLMRDANGVCVKDPGRI